MSENLAQIILVSMLVAPRIFWLLFLTMNTHSSLQHWGEVCRDLSLSAGKDLFSTLCTRQWIHVPREMYFFVVVLPLSICQRRREAFERARSCCAINYQKGRSVLLSKAILNNKKEEEVSNVLNWLPKMSACLQNSQEFVDLPFAKLNLDSALFGSVSPSRIYGVLNEWMRHG